jgi:AraC-like DNA-binding protein
MEVLSLVANPTVEARIRQAALHLAVPYRCVGADAPLPQAAPGTAQVLVHDLEPDPCASIAWLEAAVRDRGRLTVFLLLPPSSVHVAVAVTRGAEVPIVGVELWRPTLTAHELADGLCRCCGDAARACAIWQAIERCPLPAPLRYLCRTALRRAPPEASLRDVLRLSGVGYETARRAASRHGLPAPRRFLEALRLLRAVEELQRGAGVAETARLFAFNDADHFRHSLRCQFSVTPTEAQRLGATTLLTEYRGRWCRGLCGKTQCGAAGGCTPGAETHAQPPLAAPADAHPQAAAILGMPA